MFLLMCFDGHFVGDLDFDLDLDFYFYFYLRTDRLGLRND